MKYSYVTINTGHIMRGDSDVDLLPGTTAVVQRLLSSRVGNVPGTGSRISYRFDPDPEIRAAALTVSTYVVGIPAPIWTTVFYLDDRAAVSAHDVLFRMAADIGLEQVAFDHLQAPGLATLMLPGAALATAQDVGMLADFGKSMFMVWALEGTTPTGDGGTDNVYTGE